MKRKLLSLVLSAALVLSMAACGNEDVPVTSLQSSEPASSGSESSAADKASDEGDASDAGDVGGGSSR